MYLVIELCFNSNIPPLVGNSSPRQKSADKMSEKVKHLLQVFNKLSEGKGQAPLPPPLQPKKPLQARPQQPAVYKKFDQSFAGEMPTKKVARNQASVFVPRATESRDSSLRDRLEKWNNLSNVHHCSAAGATSRQRGAREEENRYKSPKSQHQKISDLIAEKMYKFERKEMQQAFY